MSEAANIRTELGDDSGIVFVSGNFNVLHPGHIRLLRFASELGDTLVVGVNPDATPGASTPVDLRLEAVRSNRHVDHAFVVEKDVAEAIGQLRPDIVVKGREHENFDNPERAALDAYGGKLIFSSGEMAHASVSILDDVEIVNQVDILPRDYMARHNISGADLKKIGERVSDLKVIVIGDLIIDEYIDCDPLGMSQEDPTIVVTPIDKRKFIGGAGIVAAHARGLGADVSLLTVAGDDAEAVFAEQGLADYGVQTKLIRDDSRPTTLKQRFRASEKTLLRVSHLRQHAISQELSEELLDVLRDKVDGADLILFSDFNYGCLPSRLVGEITNLANARKLAMAADSQASSQLSDITRFQNMNLITPTELEARLALKNRTSGLVVVGEQLLDAAHARHAIITMGADGMVIFDKTGGFSTDRIAALNPTPRDVAGAGDSLFCATSLALTAGFDIWNASLYGALAASCQVSRVGNTPLSKTDISQILDPVPI